MKSYTNDLLNRLHESLARQQNASESIAKQAVACINIIQEILHELKTFITGYQFESKQEEIEFFKCIKPLFTSQFIYYHRILWLEQNMPVFSRRARASFLARQLAQVNRYFEANGEFYRYFRLGNQYLDEKYFLREQFDLSLNVGSVYYETDQRFTTSHDPKLAKILAYERLIGYLETSIQKLEQGEDIHPVHSEGHLQWTDSKLAMIEIIYALYAKSVFNNGKAEIKDIARFFENAFQISLGDFYRGFIDIRLRKTGKAKFLDALKDSLIRKMDEADERVFR